MGVPALFRWLSKKYPKIVEKVIEDEPVTVPDAVGDIIELPVDISLPNPNGFEVDNLYLDMNGIVHPCTHPEGKPAPETEADMMIEIFKYTERVVSMTRPRKVLFMAIDGVAPRAKMNQQRSRRFRAAQEAREKEEERLAGIALFEAMGKTVSEETKNKKSWDSNAITPGTPFMDLLAESLRYWVVHKFNTDPGWKNLQVIISDASVPGEGEHKIMDYIRRQRVHLGHDPNTQHVIYGLDADLIMLALATHEPHFKVLREDVFAQDTNSRACRICGEEGHYAAQCTGPKKDDKEKAAQKTPVKKPFIFLDVAVLREYLEIELNLPNVPFPFDFERALDDWIFLIFFVGNDFLPHLPSLEIREGAIDTLLRIWKDELPRMGGYLTNHGHVELPRAQIILEGLARREDEIFRKRREAEERQNQNAKRRKIEDVQRTLWKTDAGHHTGVEANSAPPQSPQTQLLQTQPMYHGLPSRPSFDTPRTGSTDTIAAPMSTGLPGQDQPSSTFFEEGVKALGGTNSDVVQNRRAIRMANMTAAEKLKAEMVGLVPLKTSRFSPKKGDTTKRSTDPIPPLVLPQESMDSQSTPQLEQTDVKMEKQESVKPEDTESLNVQFSSSLTTEPPNGGTPEPTQTKSVEIIAPQPVLGSDMGVDTIIPDVPPRPSTPPPPSPPTQATDDDASTNLSILDANGISLSPRGVKRKVDEIMSEVPTPDEEDAPTGDTTPLKRRVNADGSVDQEDTVKLWEPGYKDRYYSQKFGVELPDEEFRKQIAKSYMEGLCWVLHYYYQGTPSWHWFYPYHFSPFASDFQEVAKMDIKFELGAPSKPYEQLMGVFPAASRNHIPLPFHSLMTDEDSPILDFYPTDFDIDMNGKKMLWQGVALLPFIDRQRLLDAMEPRYASLTEDEVRRNTCGDNALFLAEGHPMFDFLSGLYTKRKSNEPKVIDPVLSKGISGAVLATDGWVPQSTYYPPEGLSARDMPDIHDNKAMSSKYFYPKQLTPHRSVLLNGVKRPRPTLTPADQEHVRRGGNRGRGRDNGPGYGPPERHTAYGGYVGSQSERHGSYGRGNFDSRSNPHANQQRYPPQNMHPRQPPPPPQNAYGYGYRAPPPPAPYGRGGGYSDGYGDGGYGQSTYGYGGVNGYGGSRPGPPPRGQGQRGGYGGNHDRGGYGREYRDSQSFGRGRGRGRY